MERPGRERRRDRAGHAPRLQDRPRSAVGPGLRRAADQRDGAADRYRRTSRRRALPCAAAGRGRRRCHRRAPARRRRTRHRDRRRCRAHGRGRGPRRPGRGGGCRHLDRAHPPAPAGAQHAPQLPRPHPVRPRVHRPGLRRRGCGAHGGRPLLRGGLVRARGALPARREGAPDRGIHLAARAQPRAGRRPDRRPRTGAGDDRRACGGGRLGRLRQRRRRAKPGLRGAP